MVGKIKMYSDGRVVDQKKMELDVGSCSEIDLSGINISHTLGILALGSKDGDVATLNVLTNKVQKANHGRNAINCVKLSRDGAVLHTSVGKSFCRLCSEDPKKVITSYEGHADAIVDLCLGPGPNDVYTCSKTLIQHWDTRTPKHCHTLCPTRKLNCIDIVSSKNVLLTGDTAGFLNSWNLGTMTQECNRTFCPPETRKPSGVSSIAVSPDDSWICLGTKGGYVCHYIHQNKNLVLEHAIRGKKNVTAEEPGKEEEKKHDSVVRCTFPPFLPWSALVAYHHHISMCQYLGPNPDGECFSFTQAASNQVNESEISSCTVNDDGTVFYTGHCSGKVVGYNLPDEVSPVILPVELGGKIEAMDYVESHAVRPA